MERYDRQIRFFGVEGQRKLMKSSVMIAGIGGLGSLAAIYVVMAGIGKVLLVDKGKVELSNLNRQILYSPNDIGKIKVKIAERKLKELNPEVKIEGIHLELNEDNVFDLVKEVDLVIDGMDNYKARFAINKACIAENKIFIHGAVHGMVGQMMTIIPRKGPCLRCILPEEPPTFEIIPIVNSIPAVIASLEVTETIKVLTGIGEPAIGKLIIYDGESMKFYEIKVKRKNNCIDCGEQLRSVT